jgi:general secretion pathway protein G
LRQLGGARVSVAKQSIERLGSVLDLYRLDVGTYPNSQEGLEALITRPSEAPNWSGPYVQNGQLPVDPWSHPYIYREPSTRPGHAYDLCSRGPNATAGDAGADSLICNP